MLSQLNNVIYCTTQLIQVLIFIAGCYFFSISIFGWVKRDEDCFGGYNVLKQGIYKKLGHIDKASVTQSSSIPQKRFALIIAAHNEELVVAHIIESLSRQNYPKSLYDIFVVADNCTDKTAQIACKYGAKVYKRFNTEERGKGYALEWMFSKIFAMKDKYDVVSVFDADNLVSSNFPASPALPWSKLWIVRHRFLY